MVLIFLSPAFLCVCALCVYVYVSENVCTHNTPTDHQCSPVLLEHPVCLDSSRVPGKFVHGMTPDLLSRLQEASVGTATPILWELSSTTAGYNDRLREGGQICDMTHSRHICDTNDSFVYATLMVVM